MREPPAAQAGQTGANRHQHSHPPGREELRRQVERQQREIEQLREQVAERDRRIAGAEKQIAHLERQLALRQQKENRLDESLITEEWELIEALKEQASGDGLPDKLSKKDGEAEVPCALALLQDLVGQLGRCFVDILVGDAIYLQAPFVQEVERLGLDWAFTLKENQPDLLHEAQRFTAGAPAAIESERDRELRLWHPPRVDWPVADRLVRVVKTVRIDHKREVTVSHEGAHRKKTKTDVTEESTNFYATNFELGSIPPLFVYQLGRSRWRIDTEVFQTLTTDCHLKHPAVHQSTALVVLTMIRLLAYTLSLVLYQRQICSHARGHCQSSHEFAKRLAYRFVALSPDTR